MVTAWAFVVISLASGSYSPAQIGPFETLAGCEVVRADVRADFTVLGVSAVKASRCFKIFY